MFLRTLLQLEHQCHGSNCACISRKVSRQQLGVRGMQMRMVHSVQTPFPESDRDCQLLLDRTAIKERGQENNSSEEHSSPCPVFPSNVIKAESKI